MKNWNALMAVILLLSATVFVTQSTALAKGESIGIANASLGTSSNKTELVSFVESAVAYVQKNGKDKALKEFSNKTGSFVNGDLYIYAYDFNGTNIAHPFKPDWIGKNKLDVTDSNGVPFIKNLINVAKEEKGFTYFIFPNPAHGNRDEFKIAYVMKVDDNWWLGSGIYLSCL
ncbi:MAG: cache domain-containing protein [Methanotrichaceae archaeon]|jgi:polar amino acid transport system substrate-binding protein